MDNKVLNVNKICNREQWVDMKAGDLQSVEDFRLEYFDTVIDFKDEESWCVFD